MAKRRKIGLIYEYNENWIGGTYYIQNLIAALQYIEENKKPKLIIFSKNEKEFEELKKLCGYTLMERWDINRHYSFINFLNRISFKLFKKRYFKNLNRRLDVVFPASHEFRFKPTQKFLYWIPDFQEHYYPEFFSDEEIKKRKGSQQEIIHYGRYIVFSSKAVQTDFNNLFPVNNLKQFVLQFAVTNTHSHFEADNLVRIKYNLPEKYFICCNQFWIHKNHAIVFKAINALKQQGINVTVAFSGKQYDFRFPDYFASLITLTRELDIETNIHFLGFIPRDHQLQLIKQSQAVIQPSLFEGWSTVIEDAKSLCVKIIASSINVHKEQLTDYPAKLFFDPLDHRQLSNCIKTADKKMLVNYDYLEKIKKFGNNFYSILENILNNNAAASS